MAMAAVDRAGARQAARTPLKIDNAPDAHEMAAGSTPGGDVEDAPQARRSLARQGTRLP